MKFFMLINLKLLTIANSFLLNTAEHENSSANKCENVKFYNLGARFRGCIRLIQVFFGRICMKIRFSSLWPIGVDNISLVGTRK